MINVVRKVADKINIPFTVGGGINDPEHIREILTAGADKVSINTAAVNDPDLIKIASDKFGAQCIVVAIDAKRKKDRTGKILRQWEVYTHGGRTQTGIDVVEWAKKAEKLGAGEILLTSMDRDGTQDGYDIELTSDVSKSVSIPVIASGGAGSNEHLYQGLTRGWADAVLLASLLHYRTLTIKEIKDYLINKGVVIRQ